MMLRTYVYFLLVFLGNDKVCSSGSKLSLTNRLAKVLLYEYMSKAQESCLNCVADSFTAFGYKMIFHQLLNGEMK